MSRYDVEQRVRIIAGPHLRCTGITISAYDSSDPQDRTEVMVRLDSSGRDVMVMACELRPIVYDSGMSDAT